MIKLLVNEMSSCWSTCRWTSQLFKEDNRDVTYLAPLYLANLSKIPQAHSSLKYCNLVGRRIYSSNPWPILALSVDHSLPCSFKVCPVSDYCLSSWGIQTGLGKLQKEGHESWLYFQIRGRRIRQRFSCMYEYFRFGVLNVKSSPCVLPFLPQSMDMEKYILSMTPLQTWERCPVLNSLFEQESLWMWFNLQYNEHVATWIVWY